MSKDYEFKIGIVYGVMMVVIMAIVILYLLCDFKVLPEYYCGLFEGFMGRITNKVNNILGI